MTDARTVIVGGGVIGVCAAYSLARRGAAVTLIDRGEISGEASHGNAGQIAVGHPPIPRPGLAKQAAKWAFDRASPLYIAPTHSPRMIGWLWTFHRHCAQKRLEEAMAPLSAMGLRSIELFDEWIGGEGIDCDYRRSGLMEVFRTQREFERGRRQAELMNRFGVETHVLSGEEVSHREPALLDGVAGALRTPVSASCDPARFAQGLAERAAARGAEIRTGAGVESVEHDNGAVQGARLESGELVKADSVVLAAGIWTSELAHRAGVRVPMEPAKGYHRDIKQCDPPLRTGCVLGDRYIACTPIDDRLRLAGTLEFSGLNKRLNRRRLEMLTTGAREYLSGLDGRTPMSEWTGMRPCAADGMPVIGAAPGVQGLSIATGHAMMGLTLGPATGEIIADLLADKQPRIDLSLMRADRF